MTLAPSVVVLPAFTDAEYTGEASEVDPWFDRYRFDRQFDIDGIAHPVFHASEPNVLLVPTGIGKAAAATTVSTLAAGEAVDLADATVLTVGIAGCRPAAGTLGSVFVADWVVDWDIKLRVGETTSRMQWLVDDYLWQLDETLVDRAIAAARDVELADSDRAADIRQRYNDDRTPTVDTGPTVCGDEVYHGETTAAQVAALCASYGIEEFATTEMEDAGTVTALESFGLLDQYVSIRATRRVLQTHRKHGHQCGGKHPQAREGQRQRVRVGTAVVDAFVD